MRRGAHLELGDDLGGDCVEGDQDGELLGGAGIAERVSEDKRSWRRGEVVLAEVTRRAGFRSAASSGEASELRAGGSEARSTKRGRRRPTDGRERSLPGR